MKHLFHILNDGGPIFSYTILLLLVVIIVLFIKQFLTNGNLDKTKELIKSIAWFALAWGFLGRTIGLIKAFDNVQASGELTPHLLASGLKMALVNPLLGFIVFIIARGLIIYLIVKKK